MNRTILVTGGARSGKSSIAEARTLSFAPGAIYIATAERRDTEMAARIKAHQERRGKKWQTHAEPFDLTGALAATDGQEPRLVDCLTLWLTNLMLGGHHWQAAGRALMAVRLAQTDPVVLVTNEVGAGIVPENALAREFRDAAGTLNQWVAGVAAEVILRCFEGEMKGRSHLLRGLTSDQYLVFERNFAEREGLNISIYNTWRQDARASQSG